MTPRLKYAQEGPISQSEFQAYVREQMRAALRVTLTTILEEELTALIGVAPYEQTAERRDHGNGSYERNLMTSVGKIEALPVPLSRHGYHTQDFERYQRRQTERDAAMLNMYIGGNSTEQVGGVVESLTGGQLCWVRIEEDTDEKICFWPPKMSTFGRRSSQHFGSFINDR